MKFRDFAIALAASCSTGAIADAAYADPPARVGRISYVEGDVSFQPPQQDFWTGASRNFPVANGEAFWTGDEGRLELQVGAVEAWLDRETELDVVDLEYGQTRLALSQGSIDIRVWRAPRGGVSISTPGGDITLDQPGIYRIDVEAPRDDGSYPDVELSVFEGLADAPAPNGAVTLGDGQSLLLDPGYQPQEISLVDAEIDDWARDRETNERWRWREDMSLDQTGVEELDQYGDFADVPEYGHVWFPRDVPADWAPYRYGHWAFVEPWGWTWVDDAPWGFAPFHYGRWARVGDRWGWVPGRPEPEPVYAPALVAFIGGSGFGVSLNIGGGAALGWVPLAPNEVYRPTYRVSDDYVRRVNVTNVSETVINRVTINNTTIINNVVEYRNAPATVVMRADAFSHGSPVQGQAVHATPTALASAHAIAATNFPAPTREARSGFSLQAGSAVASTSMPLRLEAPPPPARLQASRVAITTQPRGVLTPPHIQGARLAPHGTTANATRSVFIAPSQIHNAAQQGRRPDIVLHQAGTITPPRPISPPLAPNVQSRANGRGAMETAPNPPSAISGQQQLPAHGDESRRDEHHGDAHANPPSHNAQVQAGGAYPTPPKPPQPHRGSADARVPSDGGQAQTGGERHPAPSPTHLPSPPPPPPPPPPPAPPGPQPSGKTASKPGQSSERHTGQAHTGDQHHQAKPEHHDDTQQN